MPKCPKCNEEIKELRYSARRQVFQVFNIENDDNPLYDDSDFGDDDNPDYYCPECDKSLFTDENKAIEFLRG